jgi:acyl-coenzyme A synthetase/AMP-(fatty) acid ligase|tara:strand:- start:212 stop:733 length:522 start_codon:yes stop_codon:yes gene_type:complete
MDRLHWPALRCFSSTGEASSPPLYHWLSALGGYAPVMECCGGTELAGGFAAGCPLQPQAPSCFSTPAVGTQLVLLGEEAQGDARREQSAHGPNAPPTMGELALRPPLLGASFRLLGGADHHAVYFAGMPFDLEMPGVQLRRHGDAFERLPGGFYVAHGRVDDTMNLGGIKVLP